jgi:trimeric autotransporter adhesin
LNSLNLEEIRARIYTELSSIFMRIQLVLKTRANGPRCRRSVGPAVTLAAFGLFLSLLTGCGGSSSSNNNVAVVTVSPASISLVAGEVTSISALAVNSTNNTVTTTFTFNSSNTKIATISPSGNVCGGVWDSTFVVCNGLDSLGNPVTGTATITATAQGVSSGPVTVSVHPSVTSVTVEPVSGCFSIAQTHPFVAHAFHNATEITNQVGNFTWSSSIATVAPVDANGLATARVPGITAVVATVGATTSPAVPFKTCMPVLLVLHVNGDPAGVPTEAVTMNVTDTKTIQADMVDELGAVTPNAPVTILSNNSTVASLSGTTLTAQSPGGAGLQAVCAPPTCGNGINTPIYSNLFSVTVNGASPNTISVFAASSFPPPSGTSSTLVPIDISKNPPAVGTAITLPGVPNSIVFDRAGARAFIGSSAGLIILDVPSKAVSLATPVPIGKVLAVSADGNKVILSNAADDPSTGNPIDPFPSEQRVWVFDRTANTITTFVLTGAVAASFDDDLFRAYVVASNGNVYILSPVLTTVTTSIGGSSTDATTLASGPFVYIANSAGLKVMATCNNVSQAVTPPTNSSTIQLVGSVKNSNTIVAMDSTGLDVETVTTSALTPPVAITLANCPGNVSYSNQFIDFGLGPITANQLLVASNGSHVAVFAAGLNKVLTAVPAPGGVVFAIPLPAGATEALSGGMTPDGNLIWAGIAGTNSVDRINLNNGTDDMQVAMTFKKSDGSPAPPNVVGLQPK